MCNIEAALGMGLTIYFILCVRLHFLMLSACFVAVLHNIVGHQMPNSFSVS
jgi:hypothetical protein